MVPDATGVLLGAAATLCADAGPEDADAKGLPDADDGAAPLSPAVGVAETGALPTGVLAGLFPGLLCEADVENTTSEHE